MVDTNISGDIVKGATLFGVALTLLGLTFVIEEDIIDIIFFIAMFFYLILSALAFKQDIDRQRKLKQKI